MIEPDHPRLTIRRQCELVGISRSAFYAPAAAETPLNLSLMRLIDEQFLETPWYGSRQMARHLRRHGHTVGRKRIRRLMRKMGLQAVYQRPKTTVPHPEHKKWPYLLRNLDIVRPNHVWCADITYIPMRRGFLYLVAVMDWASRRVLAWRLSNTMDVDFCIAALEEAMVRHGRPEIFNTDQGSQFTSPRFTEVLTDAGVRISMDGRGRWMDNVFIERLWRSMKYECIYLHAYETGSEARAGIGRWINYYNFDRLTQHTVGVRPSKSTRRPATSDWRRDGPQAQAYEGRQSVRQDGTISIEASRPPCARSEHVAAEALREDLPRAGEILAMEPPNDDFEYDAAAAERKVGGAASIAAVDMVGGQAAQGAAHPGGRGMKDERDLLGIDGRAIDDEAVRHRITNAKLLIHCLIPSRTSADRTTGLHQK